MAWAFSEYLLKRNSLSFFVTHYPQLSGLKDIYPHLVQNVHLASTLQRSSGEIHYTHKLQVGACSVSKDYGVELAAACGWPDAVFQEAIIIHRTVEELLPDDRVCEDSSEPTVGNQAFRVVSDVHHQLKAVMSGEEMLSIGDIHGRMIRLQKQVLERRCLEEIREEIDSCER